MKFSLSSYHPTFILLFFILNLLVACGGGNSTKNKPQEPRSPEIAKAPKTKCSVVVTGENAGVTYKIISESNYKGDIKFNCSHDKKHPTAQKYFLINGVPSLNIVNLKRDTKIISNCILNNSPFTETLNVNFDYKTGVVNTRINSTIRGNSNCKSTYKSPLETTVVSHESIFNLLEVWGTDISESNKTKTGLIETDCLQKATTKANKNDQLPVCKTTKSDQFVITDDTGKVHTIEKKVSF